MSERTAENKKSELTMSVLLVVVVAMLAVPVAISVFRDVELVAVLLKSTPFVLISVAMVSIFLARKQES